MSTGNCCKKIIRVQEIQTKTNTTIRFSNMHCHPCKMAVILREVNNISYL